MVAWDWKTNTWACGECGASGNHALANFCARCGEPVADKVASVAAPISSLEDCPIEEHFVLRSPDVLLNIFGVALVVEKTSGNATAFPDPLRENSSFELPRIDNGIDQVRFDQWWVYVLDARGTLFGFPTSALRSEDMTRHTNKWRLCAEKVHNFWSFKDRLIVLGEEDRKIKMGKIPMPNFGAGEEMDYKPRERETPFEVETVVPLHGGDFRATLIGKNKMASLSDKGVSDPREVSLDGDHWIGSYRGDTPRLATRLENGEGEVVSFSRDEIFQDRIPDLRATALYTIDIDRQDWFVAVTSDSIHLIDPLNSDNSSHKVFMKQADMCTSFGNLFAGFQGNEDPARSSQQMLVVFQFDRHAISRLYAGSLKADLAPVTAPAGFGHCLYVLLKESNTTKLCCYSLGGDERG